MTTATLDRPSLKRLQLPLKWVGGKSKILTQYDRLFPETFDFYFEPFLGGGSVYFYLYNQGKCDRAFLSDANGLLINVYRVIKEHPESLINLLNYYISEHCLEFYKRIRASRPEEEIERAARFIYLNKTCFNGLYRENSKGEFNVPIGRYKNPNICNESAIAFVHDALQNAFLSPFTIKDWARHINPEKDDFVYLDPPYDPIHKSKSFTSYTSNGFAQKDQEFLADLYRNLDRRGVKVMLSNSDTENVRSLYSGFKIVEVLAPRAINSKGERRSVKAREVVILNY